MEKPPAHVLAGGFYYLWHIDNDSVIMVHHLAPLFIYHEWLNTFLNRK